MPKNKKEKSGSKFPDLTGDGVVTRADILKGAGAFKMDPSKKSIVDAAGDPMRMSAMLQDLNVGEKRDLQSGNTIGMSSSGTSLNTNVEGANTSNSETTKKSAGSKEFNTAFKNARGAGKTEFTFNGKKFNTNLAPSSKTTTSNSSSPDVSKSVKTNISIENIAKPKISSQNASFKDIQFNNLNTEIGAIADSTSTDNELRNLKTLGLLNKADILSGISGESIKNFNYKSGYSTQNSLGPMADDETFFNFVSGKAADAARSANPQFTKQNVNKQRLFTKEERPIQGPQQVQKNARGKAGAILGVIGRGSENYSPTKTKNTTGFTYNDILEKSSGSTFKMGFKKY